MSFAEIILRIGLAIGGWLIFIGNMLLVGVMRYADCEPGNESIWRGTLFLGVLGGGAVWASSYGMPWRSELKFVAIIGALFALYAAPVIGHGLIATTLGGESLCIVAGQTPGGVDLADFAPSLTERIWPVAQTVIGLVGLLQAWRFCFSPVGKTAAID